MDNDILQFEQMGIYDLRNYARSIGVLSPTKLKRDQLICKINAIIQGEQPQQKKTNKGRPPKQPINEQAKLDYLLPNNLFDSNDPRYKNYVGSNIRFSVGTVLREGKPSATNILYTGFYKPYNANYGFVLKKGYLTDYYKENTIILTQLANKYNLREGDFVSGASDYIESKNLMLATSVLQINGNNHQVENRQNFSDNKVVRTEIINLNTNKRVDFEIIDKICPVTKGSRVVVNFENAENTQSTMLEFLNNLAASNIKPFVISIDDQPDEIYKILNDCPEAELIKLDFGMDRQYFLESVETKIKNCLRLCENGEDVALVCYNTKRFANNILSTAILKNNCSEQVAQIFAQNKLKDIFCLASTLQKGSLTTIFVNCEQPELLEMCKTYLHFNAQSYDQTDITLDMQKSYTLNLQQIIDDFEKIKDFKQNFDKTKILEQLNLLFD